MRSVSRVRQSATVLEAVVKLFCQGRKSRRVRVLVRKTTRTRAGGANPRYLLLALLLAVTACGAPSGTTAAAQKPAAGYHPVTISDCNGHTSHFTAPPRRVVALNTAVLEMLYWLDLGKAITGIGSPPKPGTFPSSFDKSVQKLPKLAGEYSPGSYKPVPKEQLLNAQPDFVIGGFASNFTSDGAASQDELSKSGVPSYLSLSTSCASAATKPRTDLDLVYQDLTNLGRIFGVTDRSDALIKRMKDQVATVGSQVAKAAKPSVFPFEYDEGTQTPYAPGNRQAINAVITLAGARSIFADLNEAYQKTSWEQIADRNPDVILLIIYDKGSKKANQQAFDKAEDFVRSFAPLASVTAVKKGRFARLVYEEGSNGGVRNSQAVADLAHQLHPDRVK